VDSWLACEKEKKKKLSQGNGLHRGGCRWSKARGGLHAAREKTQKIRTPIRFRKLEKRKSFRSGERDRRRAFKNGHQVPRGDEGRKMKKPALLRSDKKSREHHTYARQRATGVLGPKERGHRKKRAQRKAALR